MATSRLVLSAILYGVIWSLATYFLIDFLTQHGAHDAFGLSRDQLNTLVAFTGGFLSAGVYFLIVRRSRRLGNTRSTDDSSISASPGSK